MLSQSHRKANGLDLIEAGRAGKISQWIVPYSEIVRSGIQPHVRPRTPDAKTGDPRGRWPDLRFSEGTCLSIQSGAL